MHKKSLNRQCGWRLSGEKTQQGERQMTAEATRKKGRWSHAYPSVGFSNVI